MFFDLNFIIYTLCQAVTLHLSSAQRRMSNDDERIVYQKFSMAKKQNTLLN